MDGFSTLTPLPPILLSLFLRTFLFFSRFKWIFFFSFFIYFEFYCMTIAITITSMRCCNCCCYCRRLYCNLFLSENDFHSTQLNSRTDIIMLSCWKMSFKLKILNNNSRSKTNTKKNPYTVKRATL